MQQIGVAVIAGQIEFVYLAFVGVLDGIHGKISVFEQYLIIGGIVGIPGDAGRRPDFKGGVVRQGEVGLPHPPVQVVKNIADGLLIGITGYEHIELVARHPGDDGGLGQLLLQQRRHTADILVAHIMAVGIVDVFEIIQIHHQQGADAQRLGMTEFFLHHRVKGAPIEQIGQQIIVPLVFDFLLLQHFLGDIGQHPDDPSGILEVFQAQPPAAVLLGQPVYLCRPFLGNGIPGCEIRQSALKERLICLIRPPFASYEAEQAVCQIQILFLFVVFEGADWDLGDFDDFGQAGSGFRHPQTQMLNGAGELVDFRNMDFGQIHRLLRVTVFKVAHQGRNRPGQQARHQYDAQNAHKHRGNTGQEDAVADALIKAQ